MTWLSWRTALSALSALWGHNFHSQAQAASSQWRRLSKYKPHSYSVYAVTLHIARGSRAVPSPSAFHVRSGTSIGTVPAHSPLIIGFYLPIYLVGTGKHQNINEIPKYLNHKGSSWFYFIFLPSSSIATFVIVKLTWQQFGPDTAWIFLKIFCQFMALVFHPLSSLGIVQKWRFFINASSISCRNFDIFRSVFNFIRGSSHKFDTPVNCRLYEAFEIFFCFLLCASLADFMICRKSWANEFTNTKKKKKKKLKFSGNVKIKCVEAMQRLCVGHFDGLISHEILWCDKELEKFNIFNKYS